MDSTNRSKLGYRDDSPYRDNPYIDIFTPDGSIDMSETGTPLYAVADTGEKKVLPPYSGLHSFKGANQVREFSLTLPKPEQANRFSYRVNPFEPSLSLDYQGDRFSAGADLSKGYLGARATINFDKGGLSTYKAKKMLRDGTANKKPLTKKQKKYFQAIAHGWKPKQQGGKIPGYIPPAYSERSISPTLQQMELAQTYAPQTVTPQMYETIKRVEREGTVQEAGPRQNRVNKAIEIAAHPATAAKYVLKNQRIPDNFSKGPSDGLDNVLGILNPAGIAVAATELPGDIREGNYGSAFLNALSVVPATRAGAGLLRREVSPFLRNRVIDPIRFRKEYAEVRKAYNQIPERFSSPEAIKRLESVGVNPYYAQQKPKLTFGPHEEGSHFSNIENKIHYDPYHGKMMKDELGIEMSPTAVFEHELGHKIQYDYLRSNLKDEKELIKELMGIDRKLFDDKIAMDTGLTNFDMTQSSSFNALANYDYFMNFREPYAHLREMRQTMKEKGFINDIYDPISISKIMKFVKENPQDRISSFTDITPNNMNILRNAMNRLPAAAPIAAGAAAVASQDNKTYQMGGAFEELFNYLNEDEPLPAQEVAPQQQEQSDEMDVREFELSKREQELQDQIQYNEAMMIAMQAGDNPYAMNMDRKGSFHLKGYKQEKVDDVAAYSYNYLRQKGYPPQVAAGIVANLKHESNFNPGAVGDGGKARGIAQWHPDRYARLSQNFDMKSLTGNLDALHHELQTTEKGAYDKIINARSPEEAALLVDRYYERSAGLSTWSRMNTAKNIFKSLN